MIIASKSFPAPDYNLTATLTSGQAFRWREQAEHWEGVIGSRWVRLRTKSDQIFASAVEPVSDWAWLTHYLQLELNLAEILATFPEDAPMRAAVNTCHGLRLLRQDPWECLASFILSSTKQIIQIRQIVSLLCERFGNPVNVPEGRHPLNSFPSAARLAEVGEAALRECKMGFRARYLEATARRVAASEIDLAGLGKLPVEAAREQLLQLPGVGRKIADCVLLFAYGFQPAFPVDVWVMKALRRLYFPRRHVNLPRLHRFAATHFGPNAGYAQQYLFHYMRTTRSSEAATPGRKP